MIYLELEQWTTTLPMIPTASSGRRLFLGRGRTGGRRRLNYLAGATGAATIGVVGSGDGSLSSKRMCDSLASCKTLELDVRRVLWPELRDRARISAKRCRFCVATDSTSGLLNRFHW